MSKLPSRLAGICSAASAVAMLAVPSLANATGIKVYSYAVKAVCEQDDDEELDTKINIHNPSLTGSAEYVFKVVWPEQGYAVLRRETINADEAVSIECSDFTDVEFEGFVVVLSRKLLDVVGVNEIEHGGDPERTQDIDVTVYEPKAQTVALEVWNNLQPAPP